MPRTFRVVVDGDVVTARAGLFYEHAGVEVLVDFGAHRTGLDLADLGPPPGGAAGHAPGGGGYARVGSLIVKPSAVESALRLRSRTSVRAHSLVTYRLCLEACFDDDAQARAYLERNTLVEHAAAPPPPPTTPTAPRDDGRSAVN